MQHLKDKQIKGKRDDEQKKREEMLRQALLIQKLATRLPWIVLSISLLAFIIIFLQAYYFK